MMGEINWDAPPLSAEDEALIDAYRRVGRPLDDLPHTDQMSELVRLLGRQDTDKEKHEAFRQLMRLRKMGRLPRVTHLRNAS